MITRSKYKDISDISTYFPVVGIIGPRQVGKTTLAKMLIKQISEQKETVYVDLENPEDEVKLTDPVLFFTQNQEKCVILDEIQRKPELFPVLRSMTDKKRIPSRFIILGSSSPALIRDSSESLAGRIAYEELSPLNFTEISDMKDVFYHWLSGGFPDAFLAPNDKLRNVWLSNFIDTYIERDLPMMGLDINRDLIRKLWKMVAHYHGSELNRSNLSRSLGVTIPTVKRYLSFLQGAFLTRELQPYTTNTKKRLVKSPKIYVRDSGILHSLLAIKTADELMSHPHLGNSWEGYAIEQICQLVSQDFGIYYYKTHQGAECDLVLTKGDIPYLGIEMKYTSSPKTTKGMLQSFGDLKTKKNFIITPQTDDYQLTENIRVCSLQVFLEKYLWK